MTEKIKMTIEVEAPAWLTQLFKKAAEEAGGEVAGPAEEPRRQTTVKPAAPAKAAPVKAAGKAKAAPKEEEEDDGGFGGGEDEPKTLDDVRAAMQRYAGKQGKPAALALLKGYGVKNINDLDEDKYGELVQEVDDALGDQAEAA